jgi:hypothetical protein
LQSGKLIQTAFLRLSASLYPGQCTDKTARNPAKLACAKLACCRALAGLAGLNRNEGEQKAMLLHPRSFKVKAGAPKSTSISYL